MPLIEKFICVIIFILAAGNGLFAQTEDSLSVQVDTVYVLGNEKTHNEVILREIPFQFPTTLTRNDLQLIQYRIQNLYLFNRVALQLVDQGGSTVLLIIVTESWYIFPAPILFVNERDWEKLSYGLQISHFNFRGWNQKISLGGWLGYNPGLFMNYYNPWLGKKSRLILGLSFYGNRIQNKLLDFDEDRRGVGFTLGRRFSLNLSVQLEATLNHIVLPQKYQRYSYSGNGTDWVPGLGFQFLWDKRDLFEYPSKGFYIQDNITRAGFSHRQPRFWRFRFDNRIYIPIFKGVTLATRNLLISNQGDLPIYDRNFFGYSERIRGYFDKVITSRNLMLQSVELRFTLLPVHYFTLPTPDILAPFSKDLKFGINAGIFMDNGIAWRLPRQMALKNFLSGWGAGLHLRLPFINVLRLEYALNDQSEGQFILDFPVSF